MAFNELYKLGWQVETVCDTKGMYAVTASDGIHSALMVSNISGRKQSLSIEGADLSSAKFHITDRERLLSLSPAIKEIDNNTVLLAEW